MNVEVHVDIPNSKMILFEQAFKEAELNEILGWGLYPIALVSLWEVTADLCVCMCVYIHTYIMCTHTPPPPTKEKPVRTQQKKSPLQGRKRVLTKTEFAGTLIMYFQCLEQWENKFLLFKPLNLWHFAIEALVEKYRRSVCRALPQWSSGFFSIFFKDCDTCLGEISSENNDFYMFSCYRGHWYTLEQLQFLI